MPKPKISRGKKKVGKSRPKKSPALVAAEKAVQKFEEVYGELQAMRETFAMKFPKAQKALDDIHMQEDVVKDAMADAHAAVQGSKVTVGQFTLKRRFSAGGYDPEVFTEICSALEDPSTILELLTNKVIKAIIPDNGTRKAAGKAVTFLAQNPDLAELFLPAWVDEKENTPAVTDPKI
jgi:hypothetical protein